MTYGKLDLNVHENVVSLPSCYLCHVSNDLSQDHEGPANQ